MERGLIKGNSVERGLKVIQWGEWLMIGNSVERGLIKGNSVERGLKVIQWRGG